MTNTALKLPAQKPEPSASNPKSRAHLRKTEAPDALHSNDTTSAVPPADTVAAVAAVLSPQPDVASNSDAPVASVCTSPATPAARASVSKRSQVITILKRTDGASLADMSEATGWQDHTIRAVMTGLRKQGHQIVRHKQGDTTSWLIVGGDV